MKRYVFFFVLSMISATSCKKSGLDIVEKFVQEVKADSYYYEELPDFNIRHIDALLAHAGDEQLVGRFPWPPYSSYYPGEKEVGLVMLYAIEAIRRPDSEPLRGVHIYDTNDPERQVALDDVLPLYQKWWSDNKGKGASALEKLDPLEGTGLVWLGTAVPEGL
ncbi:DUF4943 family protein [Parapedobacter sp. 2B3]|uniref:DUF4943 family protein n=1 Tax=Parapedobacter sp. 2B3 TaxID=3342381 RepID=UPI0035B60C77